MKKILISTQRIQEINEQIIILSNNLDKILNQPFWKHKISIEEKITYLKEIARARRNLWQTVTEEYPELKNKNYSVTSSTVKVEFEEDKKGGV